MVALSTIHERVLEAASRLWDGFLELSYRRPFLFPLVLAIVFFTLAYSWPALFEKDAAIGPELPSERAVPWPKLTPACQERKDKGELSQDMEWLFRYEATGSEGSGGLPYWIYRVLPDMFPEDFKELGYEGFERFGLGRENEEIASPAEAQDPTCGAGGKYYASFPLSRGFVLTHTPVRLPFVKAEIRFARVALNCASCHRGAVAVGGGVRYLNGLPSHSFNLWSYERYLADLATRDAFNAAAVIQAVDARLAKEGRAGLNLLEKLVYTEIVREMKSGDKGWQLRFGRSPAGVGRIDAFNAFKLTVAQLPDDGSVGPVDFPALWNQRPAVRSWHHYDGNTRSSLARNLGSTVGVGAATFTVRKEVARAVGKWLNDLSSPAWPFAVPDSSQVAQGEVIYKKACASCHGWPQMEKGGDRNVLTAVRVRADQGPDTWQSYNERDPQSAQSLYMKLAKVGTDSGRLAVWRDNTADENKCLELGAALTPEQLQQLGQAHDQKTGRPACRQVPATVAGNFGYRHALWEKNAFRSNGYKPADDAAAAAYLAGPLDGIWARAPYLHNGSVPTLRDLLKKKSDRPSTFVRGRSAYDEHDVGFESDSLTPDESKGLDGDKQGGGISLFDASLPGNSNGGHEYGVALPDAEKDALLAYLKTL